MTLSARFICFLIIILTITGCSTHLNAQQTISTTRVKGQRGRFTSPELDQLFGVKGRSYSDLSLKQYDLKHPMRLVKMHPLNHEDERSLLLLLDETGRWVDTLSLGYLENISLNAQLEGNRDAVCTGDFNFQEMHFYIERVFEVTPSRFVPAEKQTRIVSCSLVYEEDRSKKEIAGMQEVFHFDVVPVVSIDPALGLLERMTGTWRLSCGNDLTIFDINSDNSVYLSLDERTYINGELSPDPEDSTVLLIAFQGFYFQSPEYKNEYELELAAMEPTIERNQAIGKVSLLPEKKLWLEWYGLFDIESSEYRFPLAELVFYTENNRERPIVLKRCM